MIDTAGKAILIKTFEKILNKIGNIISDNNNKRQKLSEALIAINQAILETKIFIDSNGYIPNTNLSKLWHEALNKAIAAGFRDDLPEFLYRKADFWGAPQDWINNKASLELVPKLNELKKICGEIMVKLEK